LSQSCAYFHAHDSRSPSNHPPHAEPTARAPRIRGYAKVPTDGQSVAARVNERGPRMRIVPFSSPGRFWRGNLHTHRSRRAAGLAEGRPLLFEPRPSPVRHRSRFGGSKRFVLAGEFDRAADGRLARARQGRPVRHLGGVRCGRRPPAASANPPKWFRIVAVDATGRRAWTNPIWIDELAAA
jgi:hypothetical protein